MIYFVLDPARNAVKIGYSKMVLGRLKSLRTSASADLILLGVCAGGLPAETALHLRFKSLRLRGEWFQRTPEIESLIDQDLSAPLLAVLKKRRQSGRGIANPQDGVALRERRVALGYTQSDLAGALDVASETISRWETGSWQIKKWVDLALKGLESEKGKAA